MVLDIYLYIIMFIGIYKEVLHLWVIYALRVSNLLAMLYIVWRV